MNTKIFFGLSILLSFILVSCGKSTKKNETTTTARPAVKTAAVQQQSKNYITAADVEKVSGISGVIFVARNTHIGAGGDINFATSDSSLIVMIQIVDGSYYDSYKKYYFKSEIKGLGDEAMEGSTIKGLPDNMIAFKKGKTCVALTVFIDKNHISKNMLTPEQAISLAKIIDSRI